MDLNALQTLHRIQDIAPYLHDDERCLELFAFLRWPDGFACPAENCRSRTAYRIRRRPVWQCASCRRQTRVTSGTALHGSRLPLRHWLYAIWMVGQRKQSISALQLQKELGLGSYESAWLLLHKIRHSVLIDDDDGVQAAENVQARHERLPPTLVRPHIDGHTHDSVLVAWSDAPLIIGCDESRFRMTCFDSTDPRTLISREFELEDSPSRRDTGGPRKILHNFQAWIDGTFHGVTRKYLASYVGEFRYRYKFRENERGLPWVLAFRLLRDSRRTTRATVRQAHAIVTRARRPQEPWPTTLRWPAPRASAESAPRHRRGGGS